MASTSRQPEVKPKNAFDEIAPTSATSTTAGKKLPYDVFINHRGADVKHTLAASIYHALSREGVRVFLDSLDLQLGDTLPVQIEEAMRSASIYIAIFSRNYAESPWCLSELSFMVKTHTRIVPIFYHVDPSDLRWVSRMRGVYASAFLSHEKKGRYTTETLEEWKMALQKVSYINGFIMRNRGDEEKQLKEIVASLLAMMNRVPLEEGTYAVGLDETVTDFETYALQSPQGSQNIKVIGIVGMGGSGKTTLAKELYNRKRSSFDGSSFISEVRDASKNNLPNLQKKLLEDLLCDVEGFTIDNINQGGEIVAHYLRSRRVLIVLDDIDYEYQLKALMAGKDSLGPDSFIIITTRDMGILKRFDNSLIIYKMKPMNLPHAEQLFSWYAFNNPSPLPGFEDLVGKFINACNGLPLTLKVLGGLLRGKPKDFWESQSQKISRLLPEDVQQRLQLSYDALEEEIQAIFLDIACFYVGKDVSLALSIWEQSGWDGERSLETLVDKSLVELDNRNCIKMHSQLRDLGRQIALQKTPCRLFSDAQNTSIEKPVEDYPDDKFDTVFQILIMDNKQIPVALQTRGDYLKGEHSNLTRHLQWLLWYDCPHSSIPSGILLENLRILHLRNGFFNKLWLHNAKLPKLLEELNISGSIGEFPKSIRQLEHLQKIVIDGWPNTSLKALPEEFCQLKSLKQLAIRWCRTLTSLPRHFGSLTALQHLDLAFCDGLKELPPSFVQLVNLRYLDFRGCEKLMISPHFLGEIIGLENLNFMDCRNLKVFPAEVPCQEFLRSLNLVGTSLETLPNEVGRLVNLEVLEIGSPYLTDLPISLGNMTSLRTLNVEDCKNLTCLPSSLRLIRDLSIIGPQAVKDALEIVVEENIV